MQVRALGADDDGTHQFPHLEAGAALEHALAVDLRGLVVGAPGALEVLVLGGLDEHRDLGADPVLGALCHQLLDE